MINGSTTRHHYTDNILFEGGAGEIIENLEAGLANFRSVAASLATSKSPAAG